MNPYESPQQYAAVHDLARYSAWFTVVFAGIGFIAPYLILFGIDCMLFGNVRPVELFSQLKALMFQIPFLPFTAFVSSQLVCILLLGVFVCNRKNRPSIGPFVGSFLISVFAGATGTILGYQIVFGNLGLQGALVSSVSMAWLALLVLSLLSMLLGWRRSRTNRRIPDRFATAGELDAIKTT